VMEEGRIVEVGDPSQLKEQLGSRYAALLEAEESVRKNLWASTGWRRFIIDGGKLSENSG